MAVIETITLKNLTQYPGGSPETLTYAYVPPYKGFVAWCSLSLIDPRTGNFGPNNCIFIDIPWRQTLSYDNWWGPLNTGMSVPSPINPNVFLTAHDFEWRHHPVSNIGQLGGLGSASNYHGALIGSFSNGQIQGRTGSVGERIWCRLRSCGEQDVAIGGSFVLFQLA